MKRGVLCMAGAEKRNVPSGSAAAGAKKRKAVRRVLDTHAIKAVLDDKGMTQVELAKVLGYSSQAGVSGIITRRRTSLDKFVAVANALGYRVVVQKQGETGSEYLDLFDVVTEWTVQDK